MGYYNFTDNKKICYQEINCYNESINNFTDNKEIINYK